MVLHCKIREPLASIDSDPFPTNWTIECHLPCHNVIHFPAIHLPFWNDYNLWNLYVQRAAMDESFWVSRRLGLPTSQKKKESGCMGTVIFTPFSVVKLKRTSVIPASFKDFWAGDPQAKKTMPLEPDDWLLLLLFSSFLTASLTPSSTLLNMFAILLVLMEAFWPWDASLAISFKIVWVNASQPLLRCEFASALFTVRQALSSKTPCFAHPSRHLWRKARSVPVQKRIFLIGSETVLHTHAVAS